MNPIIHELPAEIDGCTHLQEGPWRTNRGEQWINVELLGGVLESGVFVPKRSSGYPTEWKTFSIGPDRWADFEAFAADFETDPDEAAKPVFWRGHAAALAYMLAVELGQRPLE